MCQACQVSKCGYIADSVVIEFEPCQVCQTYQGRYIADSIVIQPEMCQVCQAFKCGYIADGIIIQIEFCQGGEPRKITAFQHRNALLRDIKSGNCGKVCGSYIFSSIDPRHRSNNGISHLWCAFTEWRIDCRCLSISCVRRAKKYQES